MRYPHKIFTLLLCLLPTLALALPAGPIIGIQLGETNTHVNSETLGNFSSDIRNFSFNGRVFIGSQATAIFGYEIGYLRIRNIRVLNINGTSENGAIKQHSIDILTRFNWQFAPDINVIGRFGASYLIAVPDGGVRKFSMNDFRKHHVAHYRPVLGIGLSYKGAFPVGIEVSWMHLLEHRALAKLDFIAIGATLYSNSI